MLRKKTQFKSDLFWSRIWFEFRNDTQCLASCCCPPRPPPLDSFRHTRNTHAHTSHAHIYTHAHKHTHMQNTYMHSCSTVACHPMRFDIYGISSFKRNLHKNISKPVEKDFNIFLAAV